MASYIKVKHGWRAQLNRQGVRKSRTFKSKGSAVGWAENEEHKITHGEYKYSSKHLLDDALEKWLKEVAPNHRGYSSDKCRIGTLRAHEMALLPITDVTPTHVLNYMDGRLKDVAASTVRRELGTLGSVFAVAIRVWEWLDSSPVTKIKKPRNPPPRNRRISADERDSIVAQLNKTTTGQQVATMFLLSLETAMRQGEMCGIRKRHIFLPDYVHLPETKNGEPRNVPLTVRAQELIQEFTLQANQVSRLFRMAVRDAGISDLKFHDARHEATVMLAGKLDVMDLAKVGGWKDLKILLNTYYAPSVSSLAAKLR